MNIHIFKKLLILMIVNLYVYNLLNAQDNNISVASSCKYLGYDRWDWTIYIIAKSNVLEQINCVEYTLHSSFSESVRSICKIGNPNQPFALNGNGWRTFEIPIEVIFKNGSIKTFKYLLKFKKPLLSATLTDYEIHVGNNSKELSKGWWKWTVFIQGSMESLNKIKCVEYTLHPSFSKPVQIVCNQGTVYNNAFELTGTGWGEFLIKVRLILTDGQIKDIRPYMLRLEK